MYHQNRLNKKIIIRNSQSIKARREHTIHEEWDRGKLDPWQLGHTVNDQITTQCQSTTPTRISAPRKEKDLARSAPVE